MKRSGFARPAYSRASVPLTPATGRGVVRAVDGEVRAVPKGVTAKPGKRAPTVEEKAWMDAATNFGCVACFVAYGDPKIESAEIHHIKRGNVRLGHLFTIPLCVYHHRGTSPDARHPWKRRFESRFGPELDLLALLKQRLGFFDKYEVKE